MHQTPNIAETRNYIVVSLASSVSRDLSAIDWTVMVVGASLLRARRPGIRCQTVRDSAVSLNVFRRQLKIHCFAKYWRDVPIAH